MKDTLKKKKEDFLKIQTMGVENCWECTSGVKDLQAYLTCKMNEIAGKLLPLYFG